MSKDRYFMSSIPTSSKVGLTMFLIGAGLLIGLYSIRATTSQAQQSQTEPARTSYDCDTGSSITITRQADQNRYTYDAVNTRGETLRIQNGTSYTDGSTRVYTFTTGNNRFLVEDKGNGKATLSTSQSGSNYTTFSCTVSTGNTPGSDPVRAGW
jgi:hypothetical protein